MKRTVRLLYQLLRNTIKEVLVKAALIIVRLCHRCVRTSRVDPWDNHAMDNVYRSGLNPWWRRFKIRVKMTRYIFAYMTNRVINVSCITLTLCSTSWTKLWRDSKLTCFPGRQTMVDGSSGGDSECWSDFVNQWSIFHSHLSDAIEVCPVNMIHNFSRRKSKLALLSWSSRQWFNKEDTLN